MESKLPIDGNAPDDPRELEARIRTAQVGLVYGRGVALVLGAYLAAALLMLFPWEGVSRPSPAPWLGALSVAAAARLALIAAWRRSDAAARAAPGWGRLFWMGTLAAGIICGLWPLVAYRADDVEFLLLASTIFAGMVAVSATSGGAHLPSFLSFSVPLVLPLATAHLLSGVQVLVVTGAALLLFLAINVWLARRVNEQHAELIRARCVNEALLLSLAAEKGIAERAVVAKSRFLAAASHDLRQPLHALGLLLGALRRRGEATAGQVGRSGAVGGPAGTGDTTTSEIVEEMASSTAALTWLLDGLLDLSRLDAETAPFEPRHVDVGALFARLRSRFAPQARARGLELRVVPPRDATAWTDPLLLERVLGNLLANAVKYTPRGEVGLDCRPDPDGTCILTVTDTGIGIPEASHEEVFAEYVQLGNPAHDREAGLGLGLSIVRRSCALMGVPLAMTSIEGTGTTFTLRVPRGDPAGVPVEPAPPGARPPAGAAVLVVDDEVAVLEATGRLIESRGCTALLARGAREALRVVSVAGVRPALVLSDHRLGDDETGIDVVAALREAFDDPRLPAVVITGDASPERLREIRASGLDVLRKPVSVAALDALLAGLPGSEPGPAQDVARISLPIVRPCTRMESTTIT